MKVLFLSAMFMVLCTCTFLLTGCSKDSADKLAAPSTPCDTVGVRYSTQIIDILQQNCYSCHSATNYAATGVNLDGYDNLSVWVSNGFLVAAVTQTGSVAPMPEAFPKLPPCEINLIVAWVNQGAKNN